MESPIALFALAVYGTLAAGVATILGLGTYLVRDYLRDRRRQQ